jgi:thymidylate synthase (FAD)
MNIFKDAKAKLIGITKPIDPNLIPDSQGLLSYTARQSSPENQTNWMTAENLLKYCMDQDHWSVFDQVNLLIEIEIPRDIGRQVLRHKSMFFQEFSQRYALVTNFCLREARFQDDKNRQNSIDNVPPELNAEWLEMQKEVLAASQKAYNWAIENNIAKECARVVLPEGLTMSRMSINGTVRSWVHYTNLRRGNGTQKEHVILAKACRRELRSQLPFLLKIDLSKEDV